MKTKLKIAIGITTILILAGVIFLIWRHANLPCAHPAGTFISKKEFKFAGYGTPEAALETLHWAIAEGDFDMLLKSASPEEQIEQKKIWGDAAHFKSGMQTQNNIFKGMQIIAKKTLSTDKVELKFLMVFDQGEGRIETNYMVQPVANINGKWTPLKSDDSDFTNWDASGNIITFVAK